MQSRIESLDHLPYMVATDFSSLNGRHRIFSVRRPKRPMIEDFHRADDLFHRDGDLFHRDGERLGVSFYGQKCTWQTSYFSKSVTEKACRLKVFSSSRSRYWRSEADARPVHRRAERLGVSFFGQKCTWQTSYFDQVGD